MRDLSRTYRNIAYACAAIIAAIIVWVVVSGCEKTSLTYVWSSDYNEDWRAVCECYGREPSKPNVRVRDDCYGSPQHFRIGHGAAYGQLIGVTVEVCPDLAALRHEFSHYVSLMVRGYVGENYEGVCWL